MENEEIFIKVNGFDWDGGRSSGIHNDCTCDCCYKRSPYWGNVSLINGIHICFECVEGIFKGWVNAKKRSKD
jgi:hypothetical protein